MAATKAARTRGFPPSFKKLTPAKKSAWLAGAECQALVAQRKLDFGQVSAERRRLDKARSRIRRIVPSPARLDEWDGGHAFPPRADHPADAMRRADRVLNEQVEAEVLWPASYLQNGSTFDLVVFETERRRAALMGGDVDASRRGDGSSQSPTALARRRLEESGGQLVEMKLATEDPRVLRRQIDAYNATGRLPLELR